MTNEEFIKQGKMLVAEHTNRYLKLHPDRIDPEEVYVVWMSKTLQNSKLLMGTPNTDGLYYELTYNGDKGEIYFDAYKKIENRVVKNDL